MNANKTDNTNRAIEEVLEELRKNPLHALPFELEFIALQERYANVGQIGVLAFLRIHKRSVWRAFVLISSEFVGDPHFDLTTYLANIIKERLGRALADALEPLTVREAAKLTISLAWKRVCAFLRILIPKQWIKEVEDD